MGCGNHMKPPNDPKPLVNHHCPSKNATCGAKQHGVLDFRQPRVLLTSMFESPQRVNCFQGCHGENATPACWFQHYILGIFWYGWDLPVPCQCLGSSCMVSAGMDTFTCKESNLPNFYRSTMENILLHWEVTEIITHSRYYYHILRLLT